MSSYTQESVYAVNMVQDHLLCQEVRVGLV